MGKFALTAIVYNKRGRILGIGQNSYTRTHPLQHKASLAVGKPDGIYLHAEIAALVRVRDWTQAHKIVVTRFTKDGTPALARPCAACQAIIKQTGIKVIEHT